MNSIAEIKKYITKIKVAAGETIYQNYYGSMEDACFVDALFGEQTVVFWAEDNSVTRVFFFSKDLRELQSLLQGTPTDGIIDYITKNADEKDLIFAHTGYRLLFEMHRMSLIRVTQEEKEAIEKKKEFIKRALYYPNNVFIAQANEAAEVLRKLYVEFDKRESHLPNMKQLEELISAGQVILYKVEGEILGIYIFQIINGQFYGYQVWNATGPEGYYSMITYSENLYKKYISERGIVPNKTIPQYGWINVNNRRSMKLAESYGRKFDGLYDFIYEKQ